MMSYINETDFVIENKKLVYPEIVADGLQLYYDAKGKRDTDYHRDTMLDMSGNKNHGKLHNFAYEKHSGYKDGLVFDYIDDKLVRPTLDLKPDDFTFMLNGNIISFSPDGTVKRVQDGEVIERRGVNFLSNTNNKGHDLTYKPTKQYDQLKSWFFTPNQGEKFYVRVLVYTVDRYTQVYFSDNLVYTHTKTTDNYEGWQVIEAIFNANTSNKVSLGIRTSATSNWNEITLRNTQAINLTATFGAGNEPTIEEIQAEPDKWQWLPNPLDLLESEEYKGNDLGDMENIIDGLYKTEVLSGTEIFTDQADDSVVHVEVDGKSYQHAGSGKNLFNVKLFAQKLLDTQPTVAEQTTLDGRNVLKVTKASDKVPMSIKVKPNTRYILNYSRKLENAVTTGSAFMRFDYKDGTHQWVTVGPGDEWSNRTTVFNTGSNDEIIGVSFTFWQGGVVYLDLDSFQFEEGSTATTYEPPAPTPDYPVEIHSLNDFDVVSSVGGRNLLPTTYDLFTHDEKPYGFYKFLDEPEQVIVTLRDKDTSVDISSIYFGLTKTGYGPSGVVWFMANGELQKISGRLYNSQNYFSYYPNNEETLNKIFQRFYIKIEKGIIATPYSPAPEDIIEGDNHPLIDKINLLLDEPLRSVEDVKDRLFRDSDGVWKIERNVKVLELTNTPWSMGAESSGWNQSGETVSAYGYLIRYDHDPSVVPLVTNLKGYANSPLVSGDMEGFSVGINNSYSTIRINKSRLSEVSTLGINNWIKENNPIAYYALKAEYATIETLSQSLQDKLNNLRSFEDSNYVYTVLPNGGNYLSENIKPTLHAKFLYNNWYKEDRVINNLMIYNRALTNEEMLQNYKTIKRRWGM